MSLASTMHCFVSFPHLLPIVEAMSRCRSIIARQMNRIVERGPISPGNFEAINR